MKIRVSKSKEKPVLALFTGNKALDQWLIHEAEGIGLYFISKDDTDNDLYGIPAILCLELEEAERIESLHQLAVQAVSQGIRVIWGVSQHGNWQQQIAEELLSKEQEVIHNITDYDAVKLWQYLQEYLEQFSSERSNDEKSKLANKRVKGMLPKIIPVLSKERDELGISVPENLDKVIAVGGRRGTGCSYVAWNIAALLNAVLMEGRETGTLAKWFNNTNEDTRRKFLLSGDVVLVGGVRMAVAAPKSMTDQDLYLLSQTDSIVVVDIGDDLENELWKKATLKVLITTADPQWKDQHITDAAVRVLNRMPESFPALPDDVFGIKMDLVIPEHSREALIALWSHRPWILTQAKEIQEQWMSVFKQRRGE